MPPALSRRRHHRQLPRFQPRCIPRSKSGRQAMESVEPSSSWRPSTRCVPPGAIERLQLEERSAQQLRVWLRTRVVTWEAVAALCVSRGQRIYRHLLPAAQLTVAAVSEFFTTAAARALALCCAMRAAVAYRLAHAANVEVALGYSVSNSVAQRIIAAITRRHISRRANTPVLTAKQLPRRAEIPPPLPPPPCCIC